jgi:hypothetical protein
MMLDEGAKLGLKTSKKWEFLPLYWGVSFFRFMNLIN